MQKIFSKVSQKSKPCIEEPRDCSEEQIFPRLDVINELEQVSAFLSSRYVLSCETTQPSTSESITRYSPGRGCNIEEVTFENLKFLTLDKVPFSGWQVNREESFLVLEELNIEWCDRLKDMPRQFCGYCFIKDYHAILKQSN
ncbi:hypothetical protein FXO38_23471 [Capsicum annuum]|nr:hypothetical protein FXO38_23471 [Capsicum annuum]KAF3655008.1 hypothetical protein FXO37_16189 [Capsicum annuum]